jgi:cellulose synthase/poly-beta-1,6-N-acetylglucosamine synthase-like glycosyltransferase
VFRSSCLSIYPYLDTAKRHCMHGSSNPHQASRASFMFFQNTQSLSDHFYMYVYRYLSITLLSLCHSLSLIVSLTLSACLSLCLFVSFSFSLSHTQHLTHSPSISIFISLPLTAHSGRARHHYRRLLPGSGAAHYTVLLLPSYFILIWCCYECRRSQQATLCAVQTTGQT